MVEEVVRALLAAGVAVIACGSDRLLDCRREESGERLWVKIVCLMIAAGVAVGACGGGRLLTKGLGAIDAGNFSLLFRGFVVY